MKYVLPLFVVLALGIFAWYWWESQKSPETITPAVIVEKRAKDVAITSPMEGDVINSPLVVRGQATGTWFWEGTFPLEITDDAGTVLGSSFVTNDSGTDWMTEELVPFTGEVIFEQSSDITTGKLVLRKANPSGLPEHDDSVQIPIKFKSFEK